MSSAGTAFTMAGRLESFSNIVVFGTYATYVIMSILMLVIIIMLLPAAQVSAGRINEVLSAESSILEGGVTESPETGTVEFKDVSFHYPDGGDVLVKFLFNERESRIRLESDLAPYYRWNDVKRYFDERIATQTRR